VAFAFWINRHRHANLHVVKAVEVQLSKAPSSKDPATNDIDTLRSIAYLERYVIDVIDHGSAQGLGFAYGDMPAHMADEKAAPKIAAYVVTLSGRQPTHPEWVKEGSLLYSSNCGGCHGDDGRGVHGTFPDLTRRPLLGIERRIRRALSLEQ